VQDGPTEQPAPPLAIENKRPIGCGRARMPGDKSAAYPVHRITLFSRRLKPLLNGQRKMQGLAIHAEHSDDSAEASAGLEIESNDLHSERHSRGDRPDQSLRCDACGTRPIRSERRRGHEPIRSIVFPNGRNGVRSIERSLAVDQNVFVWCYREIKRAFAPVQFLNSPGFRNEPSASVRLVPLLR